MSRPLRLLILSVLVVLAVAFAFVFLRDGGRQSTSTIREFQSRHGGAVLSVAFLGDGSVLSSAVDDIARVWDVDAGTELRRFAGRLYRFQSAAIARDGRTVLSPTQDAAIRYWDAETGGDRRSYSDGDAAVRVALSADGSLAAAAGIDGVVRVWDVEGQTLLGTFDGELGSIAAISFDDDGSRVIAGGASQRICAWEIADGQEQCIELPLAEPLSALTFSSDGQLAAVGTRYGTVLVWSLSASRELWSASAHDGEVTTLAFDGNGVRLASGGNDGARLWSAVDGRGLDRVAVSEGNVTALAVDPSGERVLLGTDAGAVAIWSIED